MIDRDVWIVQLFEQQNKRLTRTAYRLTGSIEQAKDLVQDTFVLALIHYEELAEHPNLAGWLTKTLQNLVLNERRRLKRHPEVPLEDIEEPPAPIPPSSLKETLPAHLPDEDQQVLTWRYEHQLSCREIALRLGISEGACRMRLHRLLQKYKTFLDSLDNDHPN